MQRILRWSVAVMLAAAFLAGASAANAEPTTLSLTLSPMVLEFHADAATPASARVTVRNNGNVPERIVAQRMDWRTAPDGAVKVEAVGTEGRSSIANYLRLSPENVVLAPGETGTFALTLDLPDGFPQVTGVYWGGFFVRALPATGSAMFGPAATIIVYDTIGSPVTHVKLASLHVTPATGSADVVAQIVNDGVGYARPSARIQLVRDGHVVSDSSENIPVLFSGASRTYEKNLDNLPAGVYQLTMTVDYGGATLLEGTTAFRIR